VLAVVGRSPQFLVGFPLSCFGVDYLAGFEAGAVVQEVGCALVGGGDVAPGVEVASPGCVHGAGEGHFVTRSVGG
jgi:hypothetical protein